MRTYTQLVNERDDLIRRQREHGCTMVLANQLADVNIRIRQRLAEHPEEIYQR